MSRLILIRHAQASFSPDPSRAFTDYDRLSTLGVTQAEALGEELAAAGVTFDRVYAGPSERHRQTAEAVARVYARRERQWPELLTSEGLGEHEGAHVVRRALEHPEYAEERSLLEAVLAGGDPGIDASGAGGERVGSAATGEAYATSSRDHTHAYLKVFRRVTRRWARGELPPALTTESWQAFRGRVEAGVRRILEESGRGATVIAFTSGGPIGSTVAWALGLGDEQALELAWIVENATLTELLFSDGRVSLKSFNAQPRIGSPELVTYV
jgi:broad specificity phosphatase PhoE